MAKPAEKNTATAVYVVDDDDGMRRALDALPSTVGYKTVVFPRPSEFLATFKPDAPGCLVLDIRMPDMSGLELQQHLHPETFSGSGSTRPNQPRSEARRRESRHRH